MHLKTSSKITDQGERVMMNHYTKASAAGSLTGSFQKILPSGFAFKDVMVAQNCVVAAGLTLNKFKWRFLKFYLVIFIWFFTFLSTYHCAQGTERIGLKKHVSICLKLIPLFHALLWCLCAYYCLKRCYSRAFHYLSRTWGVLGPWFKDPQVLHPTHSPSPC